MNNEEKLECLKNWLTENGYKFILDSNHKKAGVHFDLLVVDYAIIVKMVNNTDEEVSYFQSVRNYGHPLFIRESETAEFVIEKMNNTIVRIHKKVERRLAIREAKARNRAITEEQQRIAAEKKANGTYWSDKLKRKAERKAAREAERKKALEEAKPKRKRQRIVRYEKV